VDSNLSVLALVIVKKGEQVCLILFKKKFLSISISYNLLKWQHRNEICLQCIKFVVLAR